MFCTHSEKVLVVLVLMCWCLGVSNDVTAFVGECVDLYCSGTHDTIICYFNRVNDVCEMRGSQQNCKPPYSGRVSKEELQDRNCYKLCNLTEEESGTYDCYKGDETIILTRSFSLTVHKPKVSGTPSLIGSNTIAPNSTGGADYERLITVTAVLAVIAVVGLCALLIFCLWKKGKCGFNCWRSDGNCDSPKDTELRERLRENPDKGNDCSVVLIRNDVRYSHQDPGT